MRQKYNKILKPPNVWWISRHFQHVIKSKSEDATSAELKSDFFNF